MKGIDMTDEFNPIDLCEGDVLSFGDDTFKIEKLKQALKKACDLNLAWNLGNQLSNYGVNIERILRNYLNSEEGASRLFNEGIDCELLKPGYPSWRKVKFRIKVTLEVGTDAPEPSEPPESTEPKSPLDDIRRMIKEENP
ncbi:KGK domain-containing protein [Kamptonema formosum]|uniref:KGK domain-containing protein n=1 Tax=Kamptonema formosum TaxID=331992 RepID=UPI000345C5F8|nr:KGK domain-containing protein [Oscillatoria sp. PCC 10802]